jgi:hypothetical protein
MVTSGGSPNVRVTGAWGHFYWKVTSRIEFANADVVGPFLSQIEIVGSQASDYAGGGVKGTNYCYS